MADPHEWSKDIVRGLAQSLTIRELGEIAREMRASYDPFMRDHESWALLERVLPKRCQGMLKHAKEEHSGRLLVGQFLLHYYPGEETVKFHYVSGQVDRAADVLLMEMPVNGCRLDLGKVNGQSCALEIKTELDDLTRLEPQVRSYSEAFEHVVVLAHPKHLAGIQALVPEFCGIQTYSLNGDKCTFEIIRPSEPSPFVSPSAQIQKMTSRDLAFMLRRLGVTPIPGLRREREDILARESARTINSLFKDALRYRFGTNSAFLLGILHEIAPPDLGFFFHSRIPPSLIYCRPSIIDWM